MFCLREVELVHVRVKSALFDGGAPGVSLHLLVAKNYRTDMGMVRTWWCGEVHPWL